MSRGLANRPLQEMCTERALIAILDTDLATRTLMEILYRDLVKRAEVLLGDHFQITLHRDLAQQFLQGNSQGDLVHHLLQRLSQRELSEFDLVSFLFTTRVALVVVA